MACKLEKLDYLPELDRLVRIYAYRDFMYLTPSYRGEPPYCPTHEPIYHGEGMYFLVYYFEHNGDVYEISMSNLKEEIDFCELIGSGMSVFEAASTLCL